MLCFHVIVLDHAFTILQETEKLLWNKKVFRQLKTNTLLTKSFLEKCSTIFFLNHRNTKKIPVAGDNEKIISDDNLVSED